MDRRQALLGIMGAGTVTAALGGYKWYWWNRQPDIAYILTRERLLNEIADVIIPETDSPGAKEARVGEAMISLLKNCTKRRTLNRFIRGLKTLEKRCLDHYGKNFNACSADEKLCIVQYFEEIEGRPSGILGNILDRIAGKTFFQTLKELVAWAYCTSEQGATRALSYIHIPERYEGCIIIKEGQRCWAIE